MGGDQMTIYAVDAEISITGLRVEAESEEDARTKVEYGLRMWMDDYVPMDPDAAEVCALYPEEVEE